MTRVLIVATSRKTRGGITSVVKAHEGGEQWKKYHCHWIQTHRDGPIWRKVFYLVWAWCDFLLRIPFADIVHVHGTAGTSGKRKLFFIKLSNTLGKKTIFHFHPSGINLFNDPVEKALLKSIFDAVNLIVVLSPTWEKIINHAYLDRNYNIKVLWNPCPKVSISSIPKKKQILYAGTLVKRKGYDILLRAFGKIACNHQDWSVAFAGNPYLLDGINELEHGKQIASTLGISDQVKWLGWVGEEKKNKVFSESMIYCLPSENEGFPMGVLDAFAFGLPVVSTPVGGIPDIAEDGTNMLISDYGDIDKLSDCIEQLITNEELRRCLSLQSLQLAHTIFDIEHICENLDAIYGHLIKESLGDD